MKVFGIEFNKLKVSLIICSAILVCTILILPGCKKDDVTPVKTVPVLSLTNFAPSGANSFDQIVITGKAFSAVTTENTVLFSDSVEAQVLASTDTTITVEVPQEAITGSIKVKVGTKSIKSAANFTKMDPYWVQKANVGTTGRLAAAGFVIGSKGYLGTGYDGTNYRTDFWEYDPTSNVWTQKADFPGNGRLHATAFSVGGKGYLGTGYDGTYYNDFWEYTPSTNSWAQKADFAGVSRDYATGFAIGDKGYIGAGYDGSNDRKDFWKYDPSSNSWSQVADYPGSGSRKLYSFVIASKAYAGAGSDQATNASGTPYHDFWAYDATANSWTQKSDMAGNYFNSGASFAIGNYGYITTGGWGTNVTKEFWKYNSGKDTWTKQSDFPGGQRYSDVGFAVGRRGYVMTGRDYVHSSYASDTWCYIP